MAVSESSRNALLPSFLYAAPAAAFSSPFAASTGVGGRGLVAPSVAAAAGPAVLAQAPSEPVRKIEMYSPAFYAACTAGGIASCGSRTWPSRRSTSSSATFRLIQPSTRASHLGSVLLKEQGARGFFRGWVPTLLGYSAQAEVIADVALCPMEAVKVRVQTQPGFARGLSDGLPNFVKSEGYAGLYKGIIPLWGRQVPYTMMKFASFETVVEMIYRYAIPAPKSDCSKPLQLGVSFAGGYIAGVCCAIVSHPADNLVSFLNNARNTIVGDAVKKLGLWGLFTRGLPLRIVMIGTLTGAQWGIYDAFEVMVGLPNYWWSCSNTSRRWRAAEG